MTTESIIKEIHAERERQITEEGYTPEHDDRHDDQSLAIAAACYCLGMKYTHRNCTPLIWPWDDESWKPKSHQENLIRAGALIVAELERLERLKDNPNEQ